MILKRHENGMLKGNVFNKFLATYIVVIVFFLFMFIAVSQLVIHSVNNYDRNALSKTAEHYNKMLVQQLDNIRNVCTQIKSKNGNISGMFLNDDRNSVNNFSYSDKQKIYDELCECQILNPIIDRICLFRCDSNIVYSSMGRIDLDVMYEGLMQFGDMSLEEFRAEYLNGYKYDFFSPALVSKTSGAGDAKQKILYIESCAPSFGEKPVGYIVIEIDLKTILNMVGYISDNTQQIILYNSMGERLWSSFESGEVEVKKDNICKIEGKKYITFSSQNNIGLNFMTAKQYNEAVRETNRLRIIFICVVLLVAVIGFMLSFYFAYVNTKPIKNIIKRLDGVCGENEASHDEFRYITKSIDKIIYDISSIKNEFEKERDVLVNDFVNSLILGDVWKSEEIASAAARFKLDIESERFVAMIVEIVDERYLTGSEKIRSSSEKMRSIQKSVCKEYECRFTCMSCLYGIDTIVIIFGFKDKDDSKNIMDVENVTSTIGETLYSSLGMYIKCAMGGVYNSLEDIPYSYESAKENIADGFCTEYRHVAWYVRTDDAVSWYYYPDEVRHGLENAFRNRDSEKIDHILDLVLNENGNNRMLSETVLRLLYTNMEMTVYDLIKLYCTSIGERQMLEIDRSIEQDRGIGVFFVTIRKVYHEIMQAYPVGDFKQQILDYMSEAALKADFDRHVFAEHFFISPDYVSRFFKENTGYGFVKYSTKVKMEKACEMLRETDTSIEQIASAVGYNSVLSFRRAFKNYFGILPSEYRAQNH